MKNNSQILEHLSIHYSSGSMNAAENYVKSEVAHFPFPVRPDKPRLQKTHTKDQVLYYAKELEKYETEYEIYEKLKIQYDQQFQRMSEIMTEWVKKEALFHNVPEEYRDKVFAKAYSDGHAHGWSSIYNHLLELVDIF